MVLHPGPERGSLEDALRISVLAPVLGDLKHGPQLLSVQLQHESAELFLVGLVLPVASCFNVCLTGSSVRENMSFSPWRDGTGFSDSLPPGYTQGI